MYEEEGGYECASDHLDPEGGNQEDRVVVGAGTYACEH